SHSFESARGDDDIPGAGAEAAPSNETNSESTERRRRRRGSRGGRRRRGAKKGEEALPLEAENAEGHTGQAAAPPRALRSSAAPRELDFDSGTDVEFDGEALADEGDGSTAPLSEASAAGEGPRKKTRRRRRRRGQGGDRAADGVREDGPVEPLLPDEDDLPPRVTSGVPRELDQLPLDEDA